MDSELRKDLLLTLRFMSASKRQNNSWVIDLSTKKQKLVEMLFNHQPQRLQDFE